MNNSEKEDNLTLGILEEIESKNDVTQRHLADKLGVALGLANSYLKRCVKKGLVKIHHAPANRYLYYLTPKGFSEKSRLTAEYLSTSFDFYRQASDSISQIFRICEQNKWNRIILCGVSELAEIASLRMLEHNIQFVGICDPSSEKEKFLDHEILGSLPDLEKYDACVLTDLNNTSEMYAFLKEQTELNRILIPSILRISSLKTDY